MPEESFGARLRRERERRDIALTSISENTKISVSLFEALERDDVSRWPAGIFRRAFIRSYAAAIGLDANAIAKEFMDRFPDPAEVVRAEPVDVPKPAAAGAVRDRRKPAPLVTVIVRVPRWMTERVFTVVRPWSRA